MNKKELKQAYEEGIINKKRYQQELFKIETAPKIKKRKIQRLPQGITRDEFDLLISNVRYSNKKAKIAFLLMYGSGLRISEVVGSRDGKIKALRPEQINGNSIKILGKYSKERVVPLPKGWKPKMIKYLPIKLTQRALERSLKRACIKAKLPNYYHPHSLRHGFATRCIEQGVPLNQLQLMMGHSDIKTTGIYLQARPADALKSYEDFF